MNKLKEKCPFYSRKIFIFVRLTKQLFHNEVKKY